MFEKGRGVVHLFLMVGIQIKGQSWRDKRVVKALLRQLLHMCQLFAKDFSSVFEKWMVKLLLSTPSNYFGS